MKRAAVAVLALAIAISAFGDDDETHPNSQKGFAPDRVYDLHDIDSVNLFSGNLTVRIPIGQQYAVNGRAPFSLGLTYNSHVWRYVVTPSPVPELQPFPNITASPQKEDNAGMGWRLSLGVGNPDSYTGPDGAKHTFYDSLHSGHTKSATTRYTRDGSYLRMRKEGDSLVHIDFPDGTTRSYTQLQPVPHPGIGDWTVSNTSAKWFLTEIVEPFGNYVEVAYATDATYGAIWTLTDPARTTKIYFKDGMTSDFDFTLDHIDAVAVNGALARYSFAYQTLSIPPGLGDNTTPGNITVPVLTGITLVSVINGVTSPVGNGYSMMVNGAPAYSTAAATSGVLTRVVLPTLGSVGWTYDTRDFANGVRDGGRSPAIEYPAGVTGRAKYNPDGSQYAAWSYQYRFSLAPVCACSGGGPPGCTSGRSRQLTVWVTDPSTGAGSDVRTTISYFSNYEHVLDPRGDTCSTAAEGWLHSEHGLPLTRYAAQSGRFLSSEVRTGFDANAISSWDGRGQMPTSGTTTRRTWVSYDLDCDATSAGTFDENASVASTLTQFLDDTACGTSGNDACYTAASSFKNDGYGHYRQTSTDGNFRRPEDGSVANGGNFRTTFTNYNPTPDYSAASCSFSGTPIGSLQNWILNTATESCVVDETQARGSGVSQCTDLPNAFITKTQYDSTNGALMAKRTLKQTTGQLDSADLLSTYQYDHYGNLTVQNDYGGEAQPLDAATTFPTPTDAAYTLTHSQETNLSYGGVVLKNKVTYSNGVVASDETYDKSTGKVTATRDISGLSTTYSYDLLGRVTGVSPPGAAATTYTYSDASFSGGVFTPAKVLAVTDGTASGIGTVKKEYQFDAFGRLWRTKSLLADGTWSIVQNTYDVLGRTTASSAPELLSTQESAFQPAHTTTFEAFDVADRPRTVTAPDSTVTSFTFAGVRQTRRFVNITVGGVSTTVRVTEVRDPQGRLVQVEEPSGTTSSASPVGAQTSTFYRYDSANHLTLVKTTSGNVTQSRSFSYDGRGFLTQEQHPELDGNSIQYVYSTIGYDARGHALGKLSGTVNGLHDLRFAFDASERLTDVWDNGDQHRRLKQYSYWSDNDNATPPNLAAGKVYQAVRTNHLPGGDIVVTETYTYATTERSGRPSKRDTRVTNASGTTLQLFSQTFGYDAFGAPSQIAYPACDSSVPCGSPPVVSVPFTRHNGFLTAVGSHASSISYNPDGTVNTVTHGPVGSAIVDTYDPDSSGMSRPGSITFAGLCTPPTAVVSGDSTVSAGGTATIQAALTGTAPWTITWSDQQTTTTSQNPATRSVTPNATTRYTITALSDATGCAGSSTGSATVTVSSCTAPVGTVSGGGTIAPGSSTTIYATLTGTAPWTITWSDGQTQTTSSNPAAYTVSPTSTTQYSINALHDGNGCAGSGSGSATVTVSSCTAPVGTVSGGGTIASGASATIYASLTGTAPWTITWSDGQTQTTSSNPAARTVSPTSTTQYSINALHDGNGCAGSGSGSATVTVVNLSPPAAFVATTNQNSTLVVSLQWSAGAGATWYQIERATRIAANDWTTVTTYVTSLSASDQFQATASPATYLYRVRSGTTVNRTDVVSFTASPLDYATVATALFSDEPLVGGSTRIRGAHIGELRRAIDAVRYAAGLPAAWTSYAALGGTIGAADKIEARARLDDAVQALLGHNLSYTGETPAANGLIRAYQIQQIRDGVR